MIQCNCCRREYSQEHYRTWISEGHWYTANICRECEAKAEHHMLQILLEESKGSKQEDEG